MASLSLEPPTEAAVTMALSSGTSPSMEATRRECTTPIRMPGQAKATLHEICKVMGLSGKPAGIHGGEVARYCLEGKIKEVADYCETDIVNTYRVWLRYELFRGRLTSAFFAASETNLIELRGKPHLIDLAQ
jgi:3'-5' exonuclease